MTGEKTNRKIFGILSGVLVYLIWFFLIFSFESRTISPNQMNLYNPFIAWIYFGPIPLFVAAGLYYFTGSSLPVPERKQQLSTLKGIIAGFFLWLAVIATLHVWMSDTDNYGFFLSLGGYLIMLVFITILQRKTRIPTL